MPTCGGGSCCSCKKLPVTMAIEGALRQAALWTQPGSNTGRNLLARINQGDSQRLDTERQRTLACTSIMPRPAKLPSLEGIDITELKLAILSVLDQHHCGPEFRKVMHAQLGDLLERCGGARKVLQTALAAIRRNR
jgi:hypothetical protein